MPMLVLLAEAWCVERWCSPHPCAKGKHERGTGGIVRGTVRLSPDTPLFRQRRERMGHPGGFGCGDFLHPMGLLVLL